MTSYYRPIAQVDQRRPEGAFPIAGHRHIWFTHVEVLQRDGPSKLIAADKVPNDVLTRLNTARDPIAGLDMTSVKLMGVLNTTPDSFSDGGHFAQTDVAISHAVQMLEDGAHILDVGGESTRPGAAFVPADEEVSRIVPVIAGLRKAGVKVPISVDTRKADVAQAALTAGASVLNDVSAFSFDPQMPELAAQSGAPVCLMHAQGDPKTMQNAPHYQNVLLDVYDYLDGCLAQAVAAGVDRSNIILDPGIGFGKTANHNLELIRGLSLFHGLGCALLLGVSRKRFIGTIGNQSQADKRAPGSVAIALHGLMQGVQIIRAHDIEEHAQAFALWSALHS